MGGARLGTQGLARVMSGSGFRVISGLIASFFLGLEVRIVQGLALGLEVWLKTLGSSWIVSGPEIKLESSWIKPSLIPDSAPPLFGFFVSFGPPSLIYWEDEFHNINTLIPNFIAPSKQIRFDPHGFPISTSAVQQSLGGVIGMATVVNLLSFSLSCIGSGRQTSPRRNFKMSHFARFGSPSGGLDTNPSIILTLFFVVTWASTTSVKTDSQSASMPPKAFPKVSTPLSISAFHPQP
ncbi:hypothetical protein CRG98_001807 [Punica granatum]|uniref:Uncharacterized protein n=1 Tax=Punica granatum TaxID=22663 RepID=A0A2I0LAX3_PUNGR|nr:hypothetical protein CRG98_001807 [Punica granatum]